MCGVKYLTSFVDSLPPLRLLRFLIASAFLFRPISANCSHHFFFNDGRPADGNNQTADEQQRQNILWTFLEDTKQCDDELSSLLSTGNSSTVQQEQQQLDQRLRPCGNELLDIELAPHSVFPVGKNILPYVQLNISVTTFLPVDELFIRFRCIYAPNLDDYLCHNHNIQREKWGRMIWPCRRLRIDQKQRQFHFSYTCFRLFSLSQYSIEFFVLNRNEFCRRELIVTIPAEGQLDPKIAHFYEGIRSDQAAHTAPSWSPLLALDTSFSESLIVQLHPSEWLMQSQQHRHSTVSVAAFSIISSSSPASSSQQNNNDNDHQHHQTAADDHQHHSSDQITNTDDYSSDNLTLLNRHQQHNEQRQQLFLLSRKVPFLGRNDLEKKSRNVYRWAWSDMDAGNYTLFAFVEPGDGDCRLACRHPRRNSSNAHQQNGINDQNGRQKCRICPHTALNFTLAVAKHSTEWRNSLLMTAVARQASICVLGLLFVLLVALVIAFLYVRIWRPRAFARLPPRPIELGAHCPTVLVLYTDDCQAHSNAVLTLCRTLEESANVKCLVDQWAFLDSPTLRPSLWLVDKLAECDFILVIFSACSTRVMAGEQLVQRRHFPDLFNSGLGFIVSRIREIASSEGVVLPQQQQLNGHLQSRANAGGSSEEGVPPRHFHHGNHTAKRAAGISLLNRFIFARFASADPSVIPPFFTSSQFGVGRGGPLVLPDQIGLLIARLHGVVDTADASFPSDPNSSSRRTHCRRFLHEADLSQLNSALEELRLYVETNPTWMGQRFITTTSNSREMGGRFEAKTGEEKEEATENIGGPVNNSVAQPQQLPEQPDGTVQIRVPTLAEQGQIAERYGLLTVDDEGEEEEDGDEDNANGQQKRILDASNVPLAKGPSSKRYRLLMVGEEDEEEEEGRGRPYASKPSKIA
uniref:SEFIR domain-containing protein n=1 Tax=Globodera rostochiensis TaxID=31243 RepID=A0A914HM19_GLORO